VLCSQLSIYRHIFILILLHALYDRSCTVPALKSVAMLQRPRYSLPILTAILPGEPGLASFIEAKDDGSGDDNWSYKTRKTQPQTNQHPPFFTGWMPFMSPNQRCRSTEEKISHFKYLISPNSSGGSSLEIIVTLLLLVLSQWMNVWIPLLLMLVMMCRSEVEWRLCSSCVNSERGKAAVSWQDDQDCRVCPRSLLLSIGSAASSNRLHRSYSMYSSIQIWTASFQALARSILWFTYIASAKNYSLTSRISLMSIGEYEDFW